MIISRTPYRISLFGGGTDYPLWFQDHNGAVISCTIDKYCYIWARYIDSYFGKQSKIVYSKIEYVDDNEKIEHLAVRECLKYMNIKRSIEITHTSDLPAYKGLGSSSAFVVGLLNALYTLKETKYRVDKERLANDAIYVEQKMIGENVGCQDQYACSFGGLNLIEFFKYKTAVTRDVIQHLDLGQYLMLFDTGTKRVASQVAGELLKEMPNKEKELKQMQELLGTFLYQSRKLQPDDFCIFMGQLMHENWQLKRQLYSGISTPEIDAIYDRGLRAGAIGGKLLGAGGGGFILFIAQPARQNKIRKALGDLKYVPFQIESGGSQIIYRG